MFLLLWLSPIFLKFFFLLYCTVKPAARKRIFSAIASSNCHNFLTPAISSSCSPLISGLFWYPYPAGFRIKKFGLSGPPNILFIADATTYILSNSLNTCQEKNAQVYSINLLYTYILLDPDLCEPVSNLQLPVLLHQVEAVPGQRVEVAVRHPVQALHGHK